MPLNTFRDGHSRPQGSGTPLIVQIARALSDRRTGHVRAEGDPPALRLPPAPPLQEADRLSALPRGACRAWQLRLRVAFPVYCLHRRPRRRPRLMMQPPPPPAPPLCLGSPCGRRQPCWLAVLLALSPQKLLLLPAPAAAVAVAAGSAHCGPSHHCLWRARTNCCCLPPQCLPAPAHVAEQGTWQLATGR